MKSLSLRRWRRRLILLHKFINNFTPDYTRDTIPPLHENNRRLSNPPVVGHIKAGTETLKSSFYPQFLSECNKLDPEIRESSSVSVLTKKSSSQIRPPSNFIYGIHDPKGILYLTQLRMGLSKLNFQKFKHNLKGTINPIVQLTMA